jgi:hypothetical protein
VLGEVLQAESRTLQPLNIECADMPRWRRLRFGVFDAAPLYEVALPRADVDAGLRHCGYDIAEGEPTTAGRRRAVAR